MKILFLALLIFFTAVQGKEKTVGTVVCDLNLHTMRESGNWYSFSQGFLGNTINGIVAEDWVDKNLAGKKIKITIYKNIAPVKKESTVRYIEEHLEEVLVASDGNRICVDLKLIGGFGRWVIISEKAACMRFSPGDDLIFEIDFI